MIVETLHWRSLHLGHYTLVIWTDTRNQEVLFAAFQVGSISQPIMHTLHVHSALLVGDAVQ